MIHFDNNPTNDQKDAEEDLFDKGKLLSAE